MTNFELSDDQRERFARAGYLGPFDLFEPEQIAELWARLRRPLMSPRDSIYPDSRLNFDRHLDVPLLGQLVARPEIVRPMADLLGEDVLCWRTSWFPKNPGDAGTDWHQTEGFTEFEGTRKLVPKDPEQIPFELTAWLAVTEASEANGCLQVIPGSHLELHYDERRNVEFRSASALAEDGPIKRGFYGYTYKDLRLDPDWEPDESEAVNLVMRPGQFVIFTSRLLHASLPNTTKDQRRIGFAMRYCAAQVAVYPNRDHFHFFGEDFPLTNYSCVLVSGQDRFGHNRISAPVPGQIELGLTTKGARR